MNNIDKIFRDNLQDYEKELPTHTWGKIKSKLEETGQRNNRIFYWRSFAAVFILMSVVSITYLTIVRPSDNVSQRSMSLNKITPKPFHTISKTHRITPVILDRTLTQAKTTYGAKNRSKNKIRNHTTSLKSIASYVSPVTLKDTLPALVDKPIYSQSTLPLELSPAELPVKVVIKRTYAISKTKPEEKNSLGTTLEKVYAQVMNLKNGEKINLKELMFKSDVLASNKKEK